MTRPAWLLSALLAALVTLEPLVSQERSTFKPVSFAILEDYDKGADLREVEADFRLFQTLEIGAWRGSFGWDDFEPERGQYDFEWLHQFAELAARHHITLRPYIGYTPEWAARPGGADAEVWNNPPARLEDWRRFTAALASALARHRNVESFEIYNEQNVQQWWDGTPADYAELLTTGSRAIRAGSPQAMMLFGGLTSPDVNWLEPVCRGAQARQAFDVLPIHAYPETWTPPDVTVENYLEGFDGFLAAADEACGRKRIWINETGFATVAGRTELEQAIWWVRAVATFLAHPRIEHIGVYEIKDLALDRPAIGDVSNYHLGLTRSDRRRKLAFGTIDMLTDLLDTGRLAVDTAQMRVRVRGPDETGDDGPGGDGGPGPAEAGRYADAGPAEAGHYAGHYAHLFTRPDGDGVLIVWTMTASVTLSVEVPGVRSSIEYDVAGNPVAWDQDASSLSEIALNAGMPRIFKLLR